MPNAIHAMAEWIGALAAAEDWKRMGLSYNVGRVTGGTTVNSLAERAECVLDLRSPTPALLESASSHVVALGREIADRHSVKLTFDAIGDRPAGLVPAEPPLVEWVREIQNDLGLPCETIMNSTNANALLALGIPATCTGLSRGAGNHTREEWLDLESLPIGWKKLWKLTSRVVA
jgi:di/tripeptidase